MFAYTAFVCILASISTITFGSPIETAAVGLNATCGPTETACAFGCCPYQNGVCCIDGFECCPSGKTCIPWPVSICVGLEEQNDKMALVSAKPTPVKSSILRCPSGTTACGADKCCRFKDGVCCEDDEHCCPQGYQCDVPARLCRKESENNEVVGWSSRVAPSEISSPKMSVGLNASCDPTETACAFGCCPYQNGVCCIDGFECCPSGKTCIPWPVSICVGLEEQNDKMALVSAKPTPVKSSTLR